MGFLVQGITGNKIESVETEYWKTKVFRFTAICILVHSVKKFREKSQSYIAVTASYRTDSIVTFVKISHCIYLHYFFIHLISKGPSVCLGITHYPAIFTRLFWFLRWLIIYITSFFIYFGSVRFILFLQLLFLVRYNILWT